MAKKKSDSSSFVLDCSISVAWFFEDETDDYSEAVHDSLAAATPWVPAHWRLEVANALLMGERRKRTTEVKTTAFLSLLNALPILVDEQTMARSWHETLQVARAHNLTVYDAAYLELAIRRNLPLASIDLALNAVAAAVGVPAFKP